MKLQFFILFQLLISSSLSAQKFTTVHGRLPNGSIPNQLLSPEFDIKPFVYKSSIGDLTDYPLITNSLTIVHARDRLRATFSDGTVVVQRIMGETFLHEEINGQIAIVLTSKRLYVIDTESRQWISENLFADEKMQFRLGNKGFAAKSDRSLFLFTIGHSSIIKIGLEGETILGMGSIGTLATIITNKRILTLSGLYADVAEEDIFNYQVRSFQILNNAILYHTDGKIYHYTDITHKFQSEDLR
ncbi:hypothetical protein LPTSP3_g11520 [Leptospira kobayashii]|uniref:Uncharacterized protein n=1 Tax=Leptospira kobayashii TaxID=1917830 RepID=A0ABN6KFL1_9LEPT|nr:hypothetical protein [Leptospira kobayashii]BDA78222.1 hypothetical protein LPTSP3_g11520 [Leptospira kobayashii]